MNGAARVTTKVGRYTYSVLDQEVIDGAVNDVGRGTGAAGGEMQKVQTGRVQRYALILIGAVALIGLAIYLINVV